MVFCFVLNVYKIAHIYIYGSIIGLGLASISLVLVNFKHNLQNILLYLVIFNENTTRRA